MADENYIDKINIGDVAYNIKDTSANAKINSLKEKFEKVNITVTGSQGEEIITFS